MKYFITSKSTCENIIGMTIKVKRGIYKTTLYTFNNIKSCSTLQHEDVLLDISYAKSDVCIWINHQL